MIQKEIWVSINGTESKYSISSHGNVRSNGFYDTSKKWRSPKILKPQNNGNGYLFVSLGRTFGQKYLHRLVCEHFLSLKDGDHVNHKDGNKLNNHFTNLEPVTRSENDLHKKRNLEWHRYPILDLETGIFYANAKEVYETFGHTKKWGYAMWKSVIQRVRLSSNHVRFLRL